MMRHFIGITTGAILGWLFAVILSYFDFVNYKDFAALFIIIGMASCLLIHYYTANKHKDLYKSVNFKSWMLFVMDLYFFLGLMFGLLIGAVVSYILIGLLILLFGNPEEANVWPNMLINNLNIGVRCFTIISSIICSIWFLSGIINYFRKKCLMDHY